MSQPNGNDELNFFRGFGIALIFSAIVYAVGALILWWKGIL